MSIDILPMQEALPYPDSNHSIWQKKPLLTFMLVFGLAFIATYFILIIALVLFGGGIDALATIMMDEHPDATSINILKVVQCFSVFGFMIVPGFIFSYLMKNDINKYLKIQNTNSIYYLFGILFLMVVMPFVGWLGILNDGMHLPAFMHGMEEWMRSMEDAAKVQTMNFLQMNSIGDLIVNIIMVGVFAAVGEEILFRGVIQNMLTNWLQKPWVAILITSFLFSFIHFQFYGFFPRMALGAVLGIAYYYSQSLWVPILMHFLNNSLQVVMVYFYQNKMTQIDINETTPIPIYMAGLSLLISIAIVFCVHQYYKKSTIASIHSS